MGISGIEPAGIPVGIGDFRDQDRIGWVIEVGQSRTLAPLNGRRFANDHDVGGQGQRSLSHYSSEGFDEDFVVPSAGTAFHDQAVFAWMLFQ